MGEQHAGTELRSGPGKERDPIARNSAVRTLWGYRLGSGEGDVARAGLAGPYQGFCVMNDVLAVTEFAREATRQSAKIPGTESMPGSSPTGADYGGSPVANFETHPEIWT